METSFFFVKQTEYLRDEKDVLSVDDFSSTIIHSAVFLSLSLSYPSVTVVS